MDTYTEYSPSWNKATGEDGVHLLVEGKPASSKKVGNIEVYGEKHYLTITPNHLTGTPTTINPRQEALEALYLAITPPVEEKPRQNTGGCGRRDAHRATRGSAARRSVTETVTRRHHRIQKPIKRGLCTDYETLALDR